MRCHICDKALHELEIQYIKEEQTFDCCFDCLDIALDAAYSGGFNPDGDEGVSNLDPDLFNSELEERYVDDDYNDPDFYSNDRPYED